MGFSVNSDALVGLSDLMDRRWEDFESARTYLQNNTQFSFFNTGVLNAIYGQHRKIVDDIDQFLSAAAEGYAGRLSTAVTEANVTYQRSDLNAAARADASMPSLRNDSPGLMGPYPPEPPAPADQTLDRSAFGDPCCPSAQLQPPRDHRGDYPYQLSVWDTLSPTTVLRDIIWKGTALAAQFGLLDRPYDILDELVRPISGDWARYVGCADVYDNLANLLGDAASCVDAGRKTVDRVWTGNAADACAQSMAAFSVTLRAAIDPLRLTAQNYRTAAEGVRAEAELLATLLTLISDSIIETLGEPEVLPFEALTEARDLARIAEDVRGALQVVSRAHKAVEASMSASQSTLDGLGVVRDHNPVPAIASAVPSLPLQGSMRFE